MFTMHLYIGYVPAVYTHWKIRETEWFDYGNSSSRLETRIESSCVDFSLTLSRLLVCNDGGLDSRWIVRGVVCGRSTWSTIMRVHTDLWVSYPTSSSFSSASEPNETIVDWNIISTVYLPIDSPDRLACLREKERAHATAPPTLSSHN